MDNLRPQRGRTRVHHQEGVEPDVLMENGSVKGWLLPGLR